MSASQKRLQRAKEIVERYRERGCIFPRELRDRSDPIRQQGNDVLVTEKYNFIEPTI